MKKLIIVLVLLVVAVVVAFGYWMQGNQPANAADRSNKIFVINRGDTVREIGNNLKSSGLIKDAVVFFLFIKLNGQDKNVQAGSYRLSPSMSLNTVINELNHGTLDIWVTVPEGYRADEIADVLEKEIPTYDESWRASLNDNEGYLFPDTYLIPRDATAEIVIEVMRNNFKNKTAQIGLTEDNPRIARTIIIASLIEREAKTDAEKPVISGIIKNRIDIGMPLQIDATIQYVKGEPKKWWPQVYQEDYKGVVSLYNTYSHAGLPPTPIANPGIEAIRSALNPQDNPYYYYIHDRTGKIHPARTDIEHAENVDKYIN